MAQVAHKFKEKSRTGDVLISENIDFNGLLLSDPVLKGLQNAGFSRPSPIQLKAIPLGRCGLDLIVQAKSGTGKTCVFSVIALESIATDTASTQVLVLAPTREIAVQIWEVINSIGSAISGLECHTFIGGLPFHEDRMKLRRCHIAVGSPGRIKQLIESGALKTDSIRLFVLDEADKLLEESFQEQINWIYSTLPDNKQMLALSATYPESLATHLTSYMRNPTYLRLNITDPALLGIRQYYQTVPYHPMSQVVFENKSKALVHILSSVSFQQCLVFSNLQTRAQTLADSLVNQGWPTACIAGCLDQKDRNEAMAKLKTYKCRVLISTDLTSRGIDADKVSMVINLDVPKDHETYLHRIGRAGRFGAFGIAITLTSDGQERLSLTTIEKKCNSHIHPLPDPLPSDLAKAEAPMFLEDVVSSEVINTDGNRKENPCGSPIAAREQGASIAAGEPNETALEPVKVSREPETIVREPDKIYGKSSPTAWKSNENVRQLDKTVKEQDETVDESNTTAAAGEPIETVLEPDVTAEQLKGVKKAEFKATYKQDMTGEERALNNLQASKQESIANGMNGHAYYDDDNLMHSVSDNVTECKSGEKESNKSNSKSMKQIEAQVLQTADDVSSKHLPEGDISGQTKYGNDLGDITGDTSTGFGLHHVAEIETTEDNDDINLVAENLVCAEDQTWLNIESKSRGGFCLPQAPTASWNPHMQAAQLSFKCEKVNLPNIFKQSIGYKHLAKPYTYIEAQQSLKAFLQENDTTRKIVDESECRTDATQSTGQNDDAEKLRNIVDELQVVFDKNLRVSIENVDQRKYLPKNPVKAEVGNETMGKGEGQENVLSPKLYRKLENCDVNDPTLAQCVGEVAPGKTRPNMAEVGFVPNITKDVSIKVGKELSVDANGKNGKNSATERIVSKAIADNSDEDIHLVSKETNLQNKLEDSKLTKTPNSHGRSRAVGYRGKFSIGHLLDIERQKETVENRDVDVLTGHGDHSNSANKTAVMGDIAKMDLSVLPADHSEKDLLQGEDYRMSVNGDGSDSRKTHPVEMKPANNDSKADNWRESESESDQVVSEHSESDFTEDSDSDSSASSDLEGLANHDDINREHKRSDTHRQPVHLENSDNSRKHQATKLQNGASSQDHPEPRHGWYNGYHCTNQATDQAYGPYAGNYGHYYTGYNRDRGQETEANRDDRPDRTGRKHRSDGHETERRNYAHHRSGMSYVHDPWRNHETNENYGHETDRSESSHPGYQEWQQQYQYYPRPAFPPPTDYWSPWSQHYYGYHGYQQHSPYPQQYPASQPYYGARHAPVLSRMDFEQALEATYKMQTEYIRTMSKLSSG